MTVIFPCCPTSELLLSLLFITCNYIAYMYYPFPFFFSFIHVVVSLAVLYSSWSKTQKYDKKDKNPYTAANYEFLFHFFFLDPSFYNIYHIIIKSHMGTHARVFLKVYMMYTMGFGRDILALALFE